VDEQQEGFGPKEDEASVTSLPWEEAWLLAGRLRAEGVPARVHPPDQSSPYGRALKTSFEVMVPKDRLKDARKITRALGGEEA
jgi:hypothetical protein